MYHLILFTDFIDDVGVKNDIGYSCLAVLIVGTGINMAQLIAMPII